MIKLLYTGKSFCARASAKACCFNCLRKLLTLIVRAHLMFESITNHLLLRKIVNFEIGLFITFSFLSSKSSKFGIKPLKINETNVQNRSWWMITKNSGKQTPKLYRYTRSSSKLRGIIHFKKALAAHSLSLLARCERSHLLSLSDQVTFNHGVKLISVCCRASYK